LTKWQWQRSIIKMLTSFIPNFSFQIFACVNILSNVTSIQNFRMIRLLEEEIEGDENIPLQFWGALKSSVWIGLRHCLSSVEHSRSKFPEDQSKHDSITNNILMFRLHLHNFFSNVFRQLKQRRRSSNSHMTLKRRRLDVVTTSRRYNYVIEITSNAGWAMLHKRSWKYMILTFQLFHCFPLTQKIMVCYLEISEISFKANVCIGWIGTVQAHRRRNEGRPI